MYLSDAVVEVRSSRKKQVDQLGLDRETQPQKRAVQEAAEAICGHEVATDVMFYEVMELLVRVGRFRRACETRPEFGVLTQEQQAASKDVLVWAVGET